MHSKPKKIAVVHDWLPLIGGAERVLEQIISVYPDADIFTLFDFLDDEQKQIFGGAKITASYLNKLPWVEKYYRKLLPFFPRAIESFDLSEYDLIISSSYSVAKGVITNAQQTHISYVHSPARYAWDLMHHYLKESGMSTGLKSHIAQHLLSNFRIWDYRTANGVDCYMANSDFIAQRIWKIYRRRAKVVYPPVAVERFTLEESKSDYYLAVSRMVPYKRIDLIAKAFKQMPDKKLVIIGDGPEMRKVQSIADTSHNVHLMGYQDTSAVVKHMQKARAFLFAAEEDFGIVAVEAQACGTPVIAYGAGGALETVIDVSLNPETGTGVHFPEQTVESLCEAVNRFEQHERQISATQCRANAERFSNAKFRKKLIDTVNENLGNFRASESAAVVASLDKLTAATK